MRSTPHRTSATRTPTNPSRIRVSRLLTLVAPAVLLAAGWAHRWTCDDAFIYFRVVTNLLHGHGPVFNPGERVEVFTSPLWLGLLSLLSAGGIRIEWIAACAGLGFSVLAVMLAQRASRLAHGDARSEHALWLPLGAVIYVVLPPAWDFATSGLEVGLCLLWVSGSYLALTTGRSRFACAILLGLGPLVRPELLLVTIVFTLALLRTSGVRRPFVLCLLAVAPWAVYQVFRMGYFGALVSNTAIAKEATSSNIAQGLAYLGDFLAPYWLSVPLALVIVFLMATRSIRLRDPLALAPLAAGILSALYVVKVGGDFMHARFLLVPLYCLLLPVFSVPIRAGASPWARGAIAGCVVWALACAAVLRLPHEMHNDIVNERSFWIGRGTSSHAVVVDGYRNTPVFIDGERLRRLAAAPTSGPRLLIDLGPFLSPPPLKTDPSEVFAARPAEPATRLIVGRWNVGVCGFVAGPSVHVVDRLGVTDPLGARLLLTERGRPGHEKLLPNQWLIARWSTDLPPGNLGREVASARTALASRDLAALVQATSGPLTRHQFMSNISHAWRLTRVRIPANPRDAMELYSN